MRATELQHERSLVTVRMSATDGTSAIAQMLATVLDAGNIRDVKNIMQ